MAMILRLATSLSTHQMRIIETYQPLAIWAMKGQRVIQPMWLLWRHGHPGHHKADPVTAFRINHEHLPVQIEKYIKRWVTQRHFGKRLSD
jgi:hypothetical protein